MHGPIFLIGFMACGKTTLCQGVAAALGPEAGVRFYDLDEEVERTAGMSVSRIFSSCGEDEFRRLESQVLSRLASEQNAVVACGGGTPCHGDNMELMNSVGTTVFLEAGVDRIVGRLLEAPVGQRPLVAGMTEAGELRAFVEELMSERMEHYSKARFRFDSSRLDTPEEVLETSRLFIKKFLVI